MIPSIFAAIEDQGHLFGPSRHHSRKRGEDQRLTLHTGIADLNTRAVQIGPAHTQRDRLEFWEADASLLINAQILNRPKVRGATHRKKTMAAQFCSPTEEARSTRRNSRLPEWLKRAAAVAQALRGHDVDRTPPAPTRHRVKGKARPADPEPVMAPPSDPLAWFTLRMVEALACGCPVRLTLPTAPVQVSADVLADVAANERSAWAK
jgi:hypothetical protein